MFRYAVRRILWSIPTLLATSLVLFVVTTLAPAPTEAAEANAASAQGSIAQARRARFLDLPAFFNADPADVRSRARAALTLVAAGDERSADAARELDRLGGAALAYVLPRLDALAPDARGRVAVSLAPVADRMGASEGRDLSQPEIATLFWSQFWEDRASDFTRAGVERAVTRLVEHGSDLRERDLRMLDTFALQALVHAMKTQVDRTTLMRLTRLAHHAAQRGPVVGPDMGDEQVRRAVADWQEWWFVYAADFVEMDGADKIVAVVADTRYGKWLRRIVSGELGLSSVDGEPVAEKLLRRAPITLLVCALALVVSILLAVPIGVVGAWRRGRTFDIASGVVLFVLYATPVFGVAEALKRVTAPNASMHARLLLAVVALAAGSLATISRWQRTAVLEVVRQDFIRTARAKGVPTWRMLVFHVMRSALLPVVTLAGLHLPALLGGAFVVEEVFGLPGIGFETLRAIESRDSAWLMAVLLAGAVAITFGIIACDIVYGALDPRSRDVIARRRGGLAP